MLHIDLTGKKALVSGVSSGIGAGIALQLARAGCDVAGCGQSRDSDSGPQDFLKNIAAAGRRAVYHSVNIASPEGPQQWVEQAAAELGGVDFVVSNAGKNVFAGTDKCDEKTFASSMDLNLAAHWRLAKAAKPLLDKAQQPVILIITSNHAWSTMAGCFPYNVAKAGLLALTQSLAIEFGPHIRTVGLAPGFIDTPGNQEWFDSFADPAAERARTEKRHPVGRIGNVEEMGTLCAFLCSGHAGFISGTTLLADGGVGALME